MLGSTRSMNAPSLELVLLHFVLCLLLHRHNDLLQVAWSNSSSAAQTSAMGVLGWHLTSSEHHLPQTIQCKTLLRFAQKAFCPFGKLCHFQRAYAKADQGFMMKGSLGKCKRGRLLFCLERKKLNHLQVLASPVPQPYCISTKDWCLITFNVCCYVSHLSAVCTGLWGAPLGSWNICSQICFRKENPNYPVVKIPGWPLY